MKNKSIASLSLRKLMLSALVAAPLATLPAPMWALPATQAALDAQVTSVSSGVTVSWVNASTVKVDSSATNSVVKWVDFGAGGNLIGATDTINFNLPSTSASVLNMVGSTTNASTINGKLNSNGNIFVMNPNGITIGATGVITANGVGLSTVPETDYYFLANGTLSYVPNQSTTSSTTNDITIMPGAVITAASGTGNVWVTAQDSSLAGTIDAGNVSVVSQNTGNIILGAGGSLTVGNTGTVASTLSVTSVGTVQVGDASNGNVIVYGPSASLTSGNATISSGGTGYLQIGTGAGNATLTLNAGTGNIDFATNGGVQSNNTKTLAVSITKGANVKVDADAGKLAIGGTVTGTYDVSTAAGDLTLNASTVTGAMTATAVGGSILNGGNITAASTVGLTAPTTKDITFAGKATGALTITGAGGSLGNVTLTSTDALVIPAISAANISATAAKAITQSGVLTASGNVSINAGANNVTLSQNITGAKKLTVTGKDIAQTTSAITMGASNSVTFTASGTLVIDALTTDSLTATATGAITQTGTGIVAKAATIDGGAAVTLDNAGNDFDTLTLKNAPGNISITDADDVILGKTTNVTGATTLTVTAGTVQFGAAAADALTFADLTVSASGAITDKSNNITAGNVSLTSTGGSIIINGDEGTALVAAGLNHSFGTVKLTTTNADAGVAEKGTLDLGTVSLGTGDLTAYSFSNITNSGVITAVDVIVGAGSATAPGSISLTGKSTSPAAGNQITGTISLIDDLELLSMGSALVGNYLAGDITVINAAASASLLAIGTNVYGTSHTGNISLTQATAATALNVGALNSTGALTLKSDTGAIVANLAGNKFTNVTITAAKGAVTVAADNDLTVNAESITGTGAASYTAGKNLTIGSYKGSSTTGMTTFTAGEALTDSVTNIHIFDQTTFAGKSVSVVQAGHSFGGITVNTKAANGAATIAESGTMKLVDVQTGSGAFTAESTSFDIIQNNAGAGVVTTGTATFKANGLVNLSDAADNSIAKAALTAKGNSTFSGKANVELANVTVTEGTLTVDLSGTAGAKITQKSGTTVSAYGATTLKTNGADITLANANNSFGALTIDTTAAGAVSVKELGTVNLASVDTHGGALTVESEGGSVIDSGKILATGNASFKADFGDITLDTSNSDYGTVKLVGVNVKLIDGVGSIVLDTSSATGTFDLTSTLGSITQLGSLVTLGNTTLLASAGSITLNNTSNSLGAVRFSVGGTALIDDSTGFELRAGSLAAGAVTINTAGSFSTVGTGGSSFTNNLTINAIGTIIPGAGSLLVTGTFTVNSGAEKNLSALSKSGNLAGKDPVNLGTGAYTGPTEP